MPSYTKSFNIPGKTSQELYDKVSQHIDAFIAKMSVGDFNIERDPAAKQVSVKTKMFSAKLECKENELCLDAKLSLLAAPFRSKIDEGIGKWLNRTFS